MADLVVDDVLGIGAGSHLAGVGDLLVIGSQVVAVSGPVGGLTCLDIAGGDLSIVWEAAHPAALPVGQPARAILWNGDVAVAGADPATALRPILPGGAGAAAPLAGLDAPLAVPVDLGDGRILSVGSAGLEIRAWSGTALGAAVAVAGDTPLTATVDIAAGDGVALAVGGDSATLILTGAEPEAAVRIGGDGIGLSGARVAEIAAISGTQYGLVGAADAGAIAVVALDAAGGMALTDYVLDSQATRFAGIAALAVVQTGTQTGAQTGAQTGLMTYVAAAGSDDGITLFRLAPSGRLIHAASLADTTAAALTDPSALALIAGAGALSIIAAAAEGITLMSRDLSADGQVLAGGAADDTIAGTALDDILDGGLGDDALSGGAGDDALLDGAGRDSLTGGAGADLFVMAADGEEDTIADFDPGFDRLDLSAWRMFYDAAQLTITGQADGATVIFRDEVLHLVSAAATPISAAEIAAALDLDLQRPSIVTFGLTLDGGAGDDVVLGQSGDDSLTGGAGDDRLHGGGGADTIRGGTGEDRLTGGDGADSLWGDAGFDVIDGGAGDDLIHGGAQADTLFGGAGADVIRGEDGVDTLWGGAGDDRLEGGDGNDRLFGEAGDDTLYGGNQEDVLEGGDGADMLLGDAWFDTLRGGLGDDRLYGGGQADNLWGGAGADLLVGDGGFDRLFGGSEDDTLRGGDDDDALFGEGGADWLMGEAGDDRLNGGPGDDVIDGGPGDDTLRGGAGFDRLIAGPGNDILQGDFNADTFVFADGFGSDRIVDFDATNPHERIDLSAIGAITGWADLLAGHIGIEPGGVRITAGSDTVLLEGVALADLDPGDFVF